MRPRDHRLLARLLTAALAAGLLVGAAPASHAAVVNEALVDEWYGDFLGRAPDAGAAVWVRQLDQGARPGDVAWAITHSREHAQREVTYYYEQHLGTRLDRGAGSWVDGVVGQSMNLEWVEQNVLASDAYARISRDDPSAVVDDWYDDVLGRDVLGAGERAYWVGRISAVGRLGALRELYYSPEAVQVRIASHYARLLGRDVDRGSLAYWYGKEVESDINVQVLIAATPEYRDIALASY